MKILWSRTTIVAILDPGDFFCLAAMASAGAREAKAELEAGSADPMLLAGLPHIERVVGAVRDVADELAAVIDAEEAAPPAEPPPPAPFPPPECEHCEAPATCEVEITPPWYRASLRCDACAAAQHDLPRRPIPAGPEATP